MQKIFGRLGPLFLLSSLVSAQTPSTKQKPLALTHVTVIDTTGGPAQPDMTVVIRGDRVVYMGKSGRVRVPPGSEVVDAAGKFLIPGLWDMDVLWYEPDYLPVFIANGVTGVREVLGYAEHHEWQKKARSGQLLSPRVVVATRWVDGPIPAAPSSETAAHILVVNEAEARQAVIEAQKYGADFIEVGGADTLSRNAFLALADEAKKQGIPLEGHVPIAVSVKEASNAGLKSIDTLPSVFDVGILAASSSREADVLKSWQKAANVTYSDMPTLGEGPAFRARMQLALETYNRNKAESLASVLKANHTWLCPELVAERNAVDMSFASDPRFKYISVGERAWLDNAKKQFSQIDRADGATWEKAYERCFQIVGAMHRTGVEFLAGTAAEEGPMFTIPGFSLHDELALLVQAGLTPMEALQTATLNAARFLNRERDFGTVVPGKLADLVLLDANPLQDISNTRKIAAVVYQGKLYPRASLDAMLAKIATLAGRKSVRDVLEPTIKQKGVEAAIDQYRELKRTQPDAYDFDDKYELQGLGNQLLNGMKFMDAIEIYKLNAEEFPHWWWTYDTLGEAYIAVGRKDLAMSNYRKSLELDPGNQHAALKLKQLNSQ